MNVLVIDCEFNQPSTKTIQIGAAIYKARTGELIEEMEMMVNPQEPIAPFITELTGITDADVANGLSIKEAYFKLKDFHKKHKCAKNPIVWGSGVRNDSLAIWSEASPGEENFMGYRVIDTKTLFQSLQIHNNGTIRGGLSTACETLGIPFEGKAHTALTDAKMTFKVWHRLVELFPYAILFR